MPKVTASKREQKMTIEFDPRELVSAVKEYGWSLVRAMKPELFDGLDLRVGYCEWDDEKQKFVTVFSGPVDLPPGEAERTMAKLGRARPQDSRID
jgi:hypothetical protein